MVGETCIVVHDPMVAFGGVAYLSFLLPPWPPNPFRASFQWPSWLRLSFGFKVISTGIINSCGKPGFPNMYRH
jgi:hypothetical protein